MRLVETFSAAVLILAGTFGSAHAQSAQEVGAAEGRVVLVLPFENRSGNTSLNWIGDSFPDTLDRRLNSASFLTISRDDRAFAFSHLGLPEGFHPSRATSIRIAQQVDANYVIVGSFTVAGNHINVQAQVLSVDQLRLSTPVQDGSDLPKLFDAENAIAWKVARAIDPHFGVAESTFLAAPGAVPLPAFEAYVRGANASVPSERLQRLKEAITFAPDYPSALLALGKEQYAQRDFPGAATTLSKIPPASPLALEAGFYLGLSRFNAANYSAAETAFAFVGQHLPLPEVVNNQAVAQSRQGKDAEPLFQRASALDPSDEDYHYNLAVSLFRRGDTVGALRETEAALKLKPNDNEALQLRSQLRAAAPGTHLAPTNGTGFSPLERIRRTYSETSYRQAAFQMEQLRSVRLSTLSPQARAAEYTALGKDAFAQGLMPEAETRFQSALSADPSSSDAHAGLAQVRESSGNAAEARSEALASLRLHPNAPALLVLARLDLAKESLAVAADEVSQALQLEPNNVSAQNLRRTLQARGQMVR
ncbi:MAG: tetratricopeptide repeat protein [Janthinobacterium lividum]